MTKYKLIKAVLALIVATVVTGFGVALFIHANLGSDTITVFMDGLRNSMHISLGDASRIYNFSALIFAFCMSRKDIGWTSVVYAMSTGFFIDYFDEMLIVFDIINASFLIRMIIMLIGQFCIVFSFALLIKFGSGMDQLDAAAYGLERRTKISYKYIRTFMDVFLIVTGYLMGGVVGIGSIVAMLTTGIGIDWLLKITDKKEKIYETSA